MAPSPENGSVEPGLAPGGLALTPTSLGSIFMRNRVIRSATHEGLAELNGAPTEKLTQKYLQLARGEIGAIITGYAGVQENGKSSLPRMLMLHRDELIAPYRGMVSAVHQLSTPIILQIAHCGRATRSSVTGLPTVAPSALRDGFFDEDMPNELTHDEVEELIEAFVAAIGRAQRAGFDAVQLHAAHGYMLAQFLSGHSNQREDIWGGTSEGRFRIVGEIIKRARRRFGDYPIWIKLNAYDGQKFGMTLPEAIENAKRLEYVGCSAIEVSCGTFEDGLQTVRTLKPPTDAALTYVFKFGHWPRWKKNLVKPLFPLLFSPAKPTFNYNVPAAQQIKAAVKIPLIVVGGIRTLADMNTIVEQGCADFVSMSRPLIMEPNLIKKFRENRQTEARCSNCAFCALGQEVHGLRCYNGKIPERDLI